MQARETTAGPLESSLDGIRPVLICDGLTLGSDDLRAKAQSLAEKLEPFCGSRVVLLAQQAEQIVVALAAASRANCQLLLHRSNTIAPDHLSAWQVAAIVDESLHVSPVAGPGRADRNFAVFVQTSGTTGEPKMVEHNVEALTGRIRSRQQDGQEPVRWLLTYHPATFGGLQVLLTALLTKAELVAVSHPDISRLAEAALSAHPTHISATPTFWRSFLLVLGERASQLRFRQITLGGEIADDQILARLRRWFPDASISHIYASTEAGSLFSVRDGLAGFPAGWLTEGVDGVRLRIQNGILQVLSPRVMNGYLTKSTGPAFTDDGWLHTGDLVDVAGDRVYFRGREDLMLSVGGAKVRPEEVERALLDLPEVADASVSGIPNPITGMIIGADIVLHSSVNEEQARPAILSQLRMRLELYKVPRVLRFVPSIAISAAGKKEKVKRVLPT